MDVKQTIKRLLATAHNEASTDNEVEQALRSARQLMFKYHLTEDDIRILEHERKEFKKTTKDHSTRGKNITSWESSLTKYIEQFVGGIFVYYESDHRNARQFGKAILINGIPKEAQHVIFCGPDDLVDLAIELFHDLGTIIEFTARFKYGGAFVGEGRAYGDGFVNALHNKLAEIDRLENNTKALSIIEDKKNEVVKWLKQEKGLRFTQSKPRNLKSYDNAWRDGWDDGDTIDVNSMRDSKDKRKLN